ncbi:MAG: helix-turn-helix transcriptional regulator [Treponema sp.]|nr:helix-turn-helix transcriptional regulator [Treponema sp.]
MDYKSIGQRIREYRRLRSFTQEKLAEEIGISPTHMSHIETGNTKLSLQVLVDLSQILDVSADSIIQTRKKSDDATDKTDFSEFASIYNALSDEKQKALLQIAKLL